MNEAPEQVESGEGDVAAEVQEASVILSHRRQVGQAEYDANRKARKQRAADTMKANDKKAQAAKRKAQAKAPGQPEVEDFNKRAKAIEDRINKDK